MKGLSKTMLFAFAFSAATAFAQAQTVGSFEELDQNKDGFIDEKEAANVPGLDMQTADTDGDKQLSQSEFEAAVPAGKAPGESGGGAPGGGGGGGSSQ